LTFGPVASSPDLKVFRAEDVRAVLTAFHEAFPLGAPEDLRRALASAQPDAMGEAHAAMEWEPRLREEFLARYGPPLFPMPESLEASRLFLALKLSPRYMGAGVREAARELFSSPAFLASVCLSVLVYFAAWVAPEPIFTKAFVAALTVRLALLVGVLELNQLAQACLRLYREAEAARTVEALEAVAERFGKAVGGTALRVLVLVASFGVGRALPRIPEGGLRALLGAPRYVVAEGLQVETAVAAQILADGSIVVTGVAAGTAASSARTACGDGTEKRDGYRWHHLATDKNEVSAVNGGPWTPLFQLLFAKAGMSLSAQENRVYLASHQGPHPEEYHVEVYRRLSTAVARCKTLELCRSSLVRELQKLAEEVCTPGARLHQLVTKG
jgi:hypothetical protein